LKLTDSGVTALVRYITRADERTSARHRLNQEIVKLLHNAEELVPTAEVLPGGEAPPSRDH
jgi:hypothetical protein